MTFERIHNGYFLGKSDVTGDGYVIRTRPLNDGWMVINDWEDIVLATGIERFSDAKAVAMSYDEAVAESQTPIFAAPCPIASMGDSDEQFESLIASYHTR